MAELMKIGLLWFDDDAKRPFVQKIGDASRRYLEKFGVEPDTCYVNPASMPSTEISVKGLRVVPARNILPNHFWLGVTERRSK